MVNVVSIWLNGDERGFSPSLKETYSGEICLYIYIVRRPIYYTYDRYVEAYFMEKGIFIANNS